MTQRYTIQNLYWEDFEEGLTDISPGRTITEADLVAFAGLSGDYNQVHTDAVFAAEHGLEGERLVYGLLGLAIVTGLFSRTALGAGFQPQLVALLRIDWSFNAPLCVGDTVHVEVEVLSKRTTSNPSRGIVEMQRKLVNQDGVITQEGPFTMMIRRREGAQ